jgi:hypothetical protein
MQPCRGLARTDCVGRKLTLPGRNNHPRVRPEVSPAIQLSAETAPGLAFSRTLGQTCSESIVPRKRPFGQLVRNARDATHARSVSAARRNANLRR